MIRSLNHLSYFLKDTQTKVNWKEIPSSGKSNAAQCSKTEARARDLSIVDRVRQSAANSLTATEREAEHLTHRCPDLRRFSLECLPEEPAQQGLWDHSQYRSHLYKKTITI